MYQIHWKSRLTGKTGHGEALYNKEQAEAIVQEMNKKYAGAIHHWYQEPNNPIGIIPNDQQIPSPG